MSYNIQLDNFQGPLDLLLFFIKRDELDIMDIPIARIVKEYQEYLVTLQGLNVSVSGEFIVMAATLMRIKVRMLLPQLIDESEEEFEDPRTKLVRRLLEYQQFKEAAENLSALAREHDLCHSRMISAEVETVGEEPSFYLEEVSLYKLVQTFKTLLDQMPQELPYEVEREEIHIQEQISFLLAKFVDRSQLLFSEILPSLNTRHKIITTFLAILEMIRQGQIRVKQKSVFEDIILGRIEA